MAIEKPLYWNTIGNVSMSRIDLLLKGLVSSTLCAFGVFSIANFSSNDCFMSFSIAERYLCHFTRLSVHSFVYRMAIYGIHYRIRSLLVIFYWYFSTIYLISIILLDTGTHFYDKKNKNNLFYPFTTGFMQLP